MYNTIGFIMLGMFIGASIFALLSVYMYRHNTIAEYIENDTGIVWYLKDIAKSSIDNSNVYLMESTKDGHIEGMPKIMLSKRFTLKKKFKELY